MAPLESMKSSDIITATKPVWLQHMLNSVCTSGNRVGFPDPAMVGWFVGFDVMLYTKGARPAKSSNSLLFL